MDARWFLAEERAKLGIPGRDFYSQPLTDAEMDFLLDNDIDLAVRDAQKLFGEAAFTWTSERQRAVLNMLFNLGYARFSKFHNTIAAIKRGDWDTAASCALKSLWARQVKGRANRVTDLMRQG